MQDALTMGAPPPLSAAQDKAAPLIPRIHADYFEGIIPEPPVVCGLRLKPLSIGRWRLMARCKVAFAAEGEAAATAGDLMFGVLICSMRCADFVKFISGESVESASRQFFRKYLPLLTRLLCGRETDFKTECDTWGRRFGFLPPKCFSWPVVGRWLERFSGRAIAQADAVYIMEQIGIFQKYIVSGSPDFSTNFLCDPEHEGSVTGSHWSQNIEATLREYLGWTKEEIDEEPLTKALWDFYKQKENHGLGRFMTLDEMEGADTPLTAEQVAEFEKLGEQLCRMQKSREGRANG